MATINEGLTQITAELKDTNLRYSKATEAYQAMLPMQAAQNSVLSGLGGSIKDNLKASTTGFQSFIDQLEALPVFGAISGIAKTLGGKLFSAVRQRQEDKRIAKQLGITKEEVAIRRKEQEMLSAQAENNQKLLDVATMLGYSSEQFEKMTGAQEQGEMTAAEVEKAREDRRANEKLTAAVEGVGNDISNLELGEDEESKGFFSGILDSVKGFVPAIGAALTTLGTTLMGGLVALGTKIVLALKGGLGGLGRIMRKIPGGRALGNIFKKSLGGLKAFASSPVSSVAKAGSTAAKAGGGLLKGALRAGAGALRFAGPIGAVVTAGMSIFDGFSAGIEEYKKSGNIGAAVKEGFAGAVSGLTFGLVDQETISAGMDKVGGWFKSGWDGFTGFVGNAVSGIKDVGSKVIGSAVDGFENLTGLDVPENLSEVKDMVGNALSSAAEGFNNLTGLSIPTNLTELKDTVSSTFDNIGAGFTNLTGIEVPTFDDLSEKVGNFANNMKENIAKGWESVTNMASDAWGGVKSFFGFGGDDETKDLETRQKEIDEKIAAAKERMEKFDAGENAYYGFDTQQKRDADAALVASLEAERSQLQESQEPSTPYDYPIQYTRMSDGKYYYVYNKGEGQLEVADNQEEAKRIYESASISTSPSSSGQRLESANTTASDISREYMRNGGGNTTVVNAPNNSTTVAGGGGGTAPIPVTTRDNSSASQAAASHNF